MSAIAYTKREVGIVRRKALNDRVQVELSRQEECGKCGACGIAANGSMLIEALNRAHAKLGQKVVVEISEGDIVRAASIVYLLPVVFLLFGLLIGTGIAQIAQLGESTSLVQALFSLGMFFASFLLVRRLGERMGRDGCLAVVTEIVDQ